MTLRLAGEDEIVRLIETLHQHRRMVARAFREGSVWQGGEPDMALAQMRQARILRSSGEFEYRLAPAFQRAIEYALKRSRSFSANENFAGMVERLSLLIESYITARNTLRTDEVEDTQEQFDLEAFELGELVTERIDFFEMLVENRFADVPGLDAKMRQNVYYIRQSEHLAESLGELDRRHLYAELCDNPLLADLRQIFERHVQRRRAGWHSSLLEVTQRLQAHLFALRAAAPRLNKLRLVAQFLKDNPDYSIPELEQLSEVPAWARRYPGMRIKTHPDVTSRQRAHGLADLAARVTLEPRGKAPPRTAVPLAEGGAHAAPPMVVELGPGREALQRFVLAAATSPKPLRASAWFAQEAPGVDPGAWLLYAIFSAQTRTGVNPRLWKLVKSRLIEASRPAGPILCNRLYADIEISSRLQRSAGDAACVG